MVAHDQRQADENANWNELTPNEQLVRLRELVLDGKSCQCEDCLWEYASVLGDFGVAALPLLISALRIAVTDEDGPWTDENSVAGIASWALHQIHPLKLPGCK